MTTKTDYTALAIDGVLETLTARDQALLIESDRLIRASNRLPNGHEDREPLFDQGCLKSWERDGIYELTQILEFVKGKRLSYLEEAVRVYEIVQRADRFGLGLEMREVQKLARGESLDGCLAD